jgi:hypothetical protein
MVVTSPHLTNLRELTMYEYLEGMFGIHLRALARSRHLPHLEEVDLRGCEAPAAAWWALIRSLHRTALRRLRLRGAREAQTDHHAPTDLRKHPELERIPFV